MYWSLNTPVEYYSCDLLSMYWCKSCSDLKEPYARITGLSFAPSVYCKYVHCAESSS